MTFENHLKTYLSDNEISDLMSSISDTSTRCVLLNTAKMSCEQFVNLFPNVVKHPIVDNCYIYNPNEYALGKSIWHELGCFYIQEPSAAVVSSLLNANENDIVLDLCAAPGGKTVQSSFLMNNKGLIIANDLSRDRALAIKENSERLGLANVLIVSNDFSLIYTNYINYFDKIILDAPCSGSGMFKKDPKMISDWSINKVEKFAEIQKNLILIAYEMLKPGGILSYSTCSFSKEEDEDVIEYLLNNSDAEIVPISFNPLFYVSKYKYGIHLFPNLFPGDGHYICQIKKPGVLTNSIKEKSINKSLSNITNCFDLNLTKFGDSIYGISQEAKEDKLSIVRRGIKIGEINKDVFKYNIHYARYVTSFENIFELNDSQISSYIKGETINIQVPKGYVLLKYKSINVDIAKSDGRIIKNYYPKYLRKNIVI